MSTPKTFGPLHLVAGNPYPLPVASEAPIIGRALCQSLIWASSYHHAFKLHRTSSGLFVGRSEYQNGRPSRDRDSRGYLNAVLAQPTAPVIWDPKRRLLGIPTTDEQASVGELLIRLFARAEAAGLWLAFEYLPWIEEHLRYRLRLRVRLGGATTDRDFFLHGRSMEAMLIAGLRFFDTGPAPYPGP
jgi:hypothetical protein